MQQSPTLDVAHKMPAQKKSPTRCWQRRVSTVWLSNGVPSPSLQVATQARLAFKIWQIGMQKSEYPAGRTSPTELKKLSNGDFSHLGWPNDLRLAFKIYPCQFRASIKTDRCYSCSIAPLLPKRGKQWPRVQHIQPIAARLQASVAV